MVPLLIHIEDGQWVVSVANTNIEYAFAGDTLDQQALSVLEFAMLMQHNEELGGVAGIAEGIGNPLVVPADEEPMEVVTDLLGGTDSIWLQGDEVYAEVAQEVLLDVLTEAGTALVEVVEPLIAA
jgi:hypothetical protein